MAFYKIILLLALVTIGQSAILSPLTAIVKSQKVEDFDDNSAAEAEAPAQYSFAYDVHDELTGDSKTQYETRNGNIVQGSYSLIEADGTRRIVDYTADPVNGFNAVVSRQPALAALTGVAAVAPAIPAKPSEQPTPAPDSDVEILDVRDASIHQKDNAKITTSQYPATYATYSLPLAFAPITYII